jgi:hypothetical protein
MVVENDLDGGVGGVGGVEELEKLDEFATAVAFPGLRRGRLLTRAWT